MGCRQGGAGLPPPAQVRWGHRPTVECAARAYTCGQRSAVERAEQQRSSRVAYVTWMQASRDVDVDPPASAEPRGRTIDFGLVVGVDHYPRFRSLHGAVGDATSFHAWLC